MKTIIPQTIKSKCSENYVIYLLVSLLKEQVTNLLSLKQKRTSMHLKMVN